MPDDVATLPVTFKYDPVRGEDIVQIQIDRHTTLENPATGEYQLRYPHEWEAYQSGVDPEGTSLDACSWIDPPLAQRLKEEGFTTLERVAGISDETLQAMRLPEIRRIRDRAIEDLELRERGQQYDALQDRIAELEKQLAGSMTVAEPAPVAVPAPAPAAAAPPKQARKKRRTARQKATGRTPAKRS